MIRTSNDSSINAISIDASHLEVVLERLIEGGWRLDKNCHLGTAQPLQFYPVQEADVWYWAVEVTESLRQELVRPGPIMVYQVPSLLKPRRCDWDN